MPTACQLLYLSPHKQHPTLYSCKDSRFAQGAKDGIGDQALFDGRIGRIELSCQRDHLLPPLPPSCPIRLEENMDNRVRPWTYLVRVQPTHNPHILDFHLLLTNQLVHTDL